MVSFLVVRHSLMYQEIDGEDKGAGSESLESFHEVFFLVWKFILVEKSSKGSRLRWCLLGWYCENQHKRVLRGYPREFDKGLY